MNSLVKYLEWDSNFFDFPVFKIDYTSDVEIEKVFSVNRNQTALYYVFSENIILNASVLANYNGKLVDEKVLFTKQGLEFKNNITNSFELYTETIPNDKLYELARISGKYSRYKTDKRLPSFTFEKMYNLWIENSCMNKNCVIYVCKHRK
ncbi:hypothetical protein A9996_15390 [Gelidibacter algens]|uniref:hypothetical protein n=1 Tax=Gelidibacter algens TaxID=49280 RepID=UPI0008047BB1|nr:hypothetical protein [Gelidibacter algens]OBX23958.1 hypothetical protein A9996_15390 [Gelidibacter algens]